MKSISTVKKRELYHLLVAYFNLMQVKEDAINWPPLTAEQTERFNLLLKGIKDTEEKIKVIMFGTTRVKRSQWR